jgi:hypothetical protein
VLAFVGTVGGAGKGLYTAGSATTLREVAAPTGDSVRRFNGGVQINNQGQIIAQDQQAGVPSLLTKIRLWDANAPGNQTQVAEGQFQNAGARFDAVFAFPSVNNRGETAFSALVEHDPADPGAPQCGNRCLVKSEADGDFLLLATSGAVRPRIADNGSVLLKAGDLPNDPIRIYDPALTNPNDIANTELGFTEMGRAPGLSDDGRIVAFYAVLSGTGADNLNTTPGPGIFAAIQIGNVWLIQRVAGIAGNGLLDPGERWDDADNDGVLDPGEDHGPVFAFQPDAGQSGDGELLGQRHC